MVFKKIIFQNRYVALETPSRPPPFMANTILNFHFDYWNTSLILAWDTIILERSDYHPRLQHLPHPHAHIHLPLPLPHPHHHLAQHAVNLRFYSLNLGTEVRIENNFVSKSEILTVLQSGYMYVYLLVF